MMLMYWILKFRYSLVPNDDTEGDIMDGDLNSDDNLDDNDDEDDEFVGGSISTQPLWVLPLYSLLPSHKQAKVSYLIGVFSFMYLIL